jgi:hypothetical protein
MSRIGTRFCEPHNGSSRSLRRSFSADPLNSSTILILSRTTVTGILSRPVTSPNQQSTPLLLLGSLGVLAVKSKIFGFFQGVTGVITGHLTGGHDGKKTAPRKTIRAGKSSARRTRMAKKLKTRRVRPRTSRNVSPRKKRKLLPTLFENPTPAPTAQTTVYSCPTCGLEATKALMLEHLLGSPLHQPGRAQQEQTTDQKVGEELPTVPREEDSKDSLRNLLQILLPPRPFGRRHEQKGVKL